MIVAHRIIAARVPGGGSWARVPGLLAGLCALAACGAPATPMIPTPTPLPVPTTPVSATAVAPARLVLATSLPSTSYRVAMRVTLDRDSAGRVDRETLESSALLDIALQRDARGSLRGTARVDSFVVHAGRGTDSPLAITVPLLPSGAGRGAGATPAAGAPTDGDIRVASVQVDARLDSLVLIAAVRPSLPNECDRPEAAAAAVARELLVRVPLQVAVGDRWRDSVASITCRGGVVMTLRQVIESSAERLDDGDRTLVVRRSIASTLNGTNKLPWRQTDVNGTGRGTQTVKLDVASGIVREIEGESTMTIRVTQGTMRDAKTQTVTQRTETRVQR